MYIFGILYFFVAQGFAGPNDLTHRPKSFSISEGKAVFVDFKEVLYTVTYDLNKKDASVRADISFDAPESGYPVFDSHQVPFNVILDGVDVGSLEVKTPSQETKLRVAGKAVSTGAHKLSVEVPLVTLVQFTPEGVRSAFWMSDLVDREYLERYVPANLEFDQVKMTFKVNFIGLKKKQKFYTNGVVTTSSDATFITYPAYFTSSSLFFHTAPEGAFDDIQFLYRSIDGRNLPVTIYKGESKWTPQNVVLENLKKKVILVLDSLEKDYGPFLHPSVTIYNAGLGGMEYCGATMTDEGSISHELFHSYFARGVMPANGNSGWIDEALASWRDKGYRSSNRLEGSSQLSSHPYYTRFTDREAYTFGETFIQFLDGKVRANGKLEGLHPFLRHMIEKKSLKPLFVEEFSKEMGSFFGMSFEEDFKRYTYGSSKSNTKSSNHSQHQKMSLNELQKFL